MRELIAAMKVSVDGLFEGPDGYADWVQAWSDDYGLAERIDAYLLGGRMYPCYEQYWSAIEQAPEAPLPMTGKLAHPAELRWSAVARKTPHYVLSKSLASARWPHTRLLRDLHEVQALKQQAGRGIYLMGGAHVTRSLLQAGLVDELRLIVYPLLAGAGRGLFEGPAQRLAMSLEGVRNMGDGRAELVYRLANSASH